MPIATGPRTRHFRAMTEQAPAPAHTKAPTKPFIKPDYWTNDPAPKPQAATTPSDDEDTEVSPTRYGDWVRNGIAVDF